MADYTLAFTGAQIDAAVGYANNGAAKAFALYNGTTTDKSYNVSSVTDSGTGRFQPNFTNVFLDALYFVFGSSAAERNTRGGDHCGIDTTGTGRATGSAPCANLAASDAGSNAVVFDRSTQGAAFIGDLA